MSSYSRETLGRVTPLLVPDPHERVIAGIPWTERIRTLGCPYLTLPLRCESVIQAAKAHEVTSWTRIPAGDGSPAEPTLPQAGLQRQIG